MARPDEKRRRERPAAARQTGLQLERLESRILLDGPSPVIQQMVDQVADVSYSDYLADLAAFPDRNSYTENFGDATDYIVTELQAMGLQVELQTFELLAAVPIAWNGNGYWAPVSNIIATMPGKVTPEQEYLLTAHYDSIAVNPDAYSDAYDMIFDMLSPSSPAPGADDNASGTAALLETARVMSQYPFESTVKFVFFAAEEQGLVGSDYFTRYAYYEDSTVDAYYEDPFFDPNDLVPDPDDIRAAINYDMIAYWDGDPVGGETLDVIAYTGLTYGIDSYPNLEDIIAGANPDLTPEQIQYVIASFMVAIPPPPGGSVDSSLLGQTFVNAASTYGTGLQIEYTEGNTNEDWWLTGASDHFNLWWYGWPALLCIEDIEYGIDPATDWPYTTTPNPNYHSVDDNLANANATDMATAATKTGAATIAELAGVRIDVVNGDFDSGTLGTVYDTEGDVSVVEVEPGNYAAQLTESSGAALLQELVVPSEADVLTFEYRFVALGDGDSLTVEFDGNTLFSVVGTDIGDSEWHSVQVGVSAYAGQPGTLAFRLVSVSDSNARVQLDNVELAAAAELAGEIHGYKWNDFDGDGVWDAEEPALGGWTVFLDENENGVLDGGEPFTTTDADGAYSFTDLSPGTYFVAEVLQPGWQQTFPVVTAGPEFQVNTYTIDWQQYPMVAMDADGDFVVTWTSSGQDGSLAGAYAQRYAGDGTPLGSEFQVNTYTTDAQSSESVAMDGDGDFVITWASVGQDGDGYGVYAQRYAPDGTPLGSEFQVNTYITDDQPVRSVAMDADGDFVITWPSRGQDGDGFGVYAQRFAADGTPLGAEFQVNTYTTDAQYGASAAMDADGDFVITWHSDLQDGDGMGVYAQMYAADGTPVGSEFQVNTRTTSQQEEPWVAMDADGDFVIAWVSYGQDGDKFGFGVYAQRYAAAGTPLGSEFQVNTYTPGDQFLPSVAMDANGDFVITWSSEGQDGDARGVYAQMYGADGTPLGSEFQVNTYTMDDQRYPSVGMDDAGNFLITWQSDGQDGDSLGIFAKQFTPAPDGAPHRVDLSSAQIVQDINFGNRSPVIDDGDPGYADNGWGDGANPGGYLGDYRYSPPGVGSQSASWEFTGLPAGTYAVYATWVAHPNRATDSPYEILDGMVSEGTVAANQQVAPDDVEWDSHWWEGLGIFTVDSGTLTVRLTDGANGYVIADAARAVEAAPVIGGAIDDGDLGYADSSWGDGSNPGGYEGDYRYTAPGSGTEWASWEFTGLPAGTYAVYATWVAHPNRATDAPYEILDGAVSEGIVAANQQLAPDDVEWDSHWWEGLGVFTVDSGTLTVRLTDAAGGYVIADAVRVVEATPVVGGTIDDGDLGYADSGWGDGSNPGGYEGDYRYRAAGSGSEWASWEFSGLPAGTYEVHATWVAHPNRATDAPYEILDGMVSKGTVSADQQLAPDDVEWDGHWWEGLGIFTIDGGTLVVRLTDGANGYAIADAVWVREEGAGTSEVRAAAKEDLWYGGGIVNSSIEADGHIGTVYALGGDVDASIVSHSGLIGRVIARQIGASGGNVSGEVNAAGYIGAVYALGALGGPDMTADITSGTGIGRLYSAGDLTGNISVTGNLGAVTVRGSVAGSTIDVATGAFGSLWAGGDVTNASIEVDGLLASMYAAGDFSDSSIHAGRLGRVWVGGQIKDDDTDADTHLIHADEGRFFVRHQTWAGWITLVRARWLDGVRAWVGPDPMGTGVCLFDNHQWVATVYEDFLKDGEVIPIASDSPGVCRTISPLMGDFLVLSNKVEGVDSWPQMMALGSNGFMRLTGNGMPFGTSLNPGPSVWVGDDPATPEDEGNLYGDLSLEAISLWTASLFPDGTGTLEITAHGKLRGESGEAGPLDVEFQMSVAEPTTTQAEVSVSYTYVVTEDFLLDADAAGRHEAFKLFECASMFVDQTAHDSERVEYASVAGPVTSDFIDVAQPGFIFVDPDPMAEAWLELLQINKLAAPNGNAPSMLALLDVIDPADFTPQGWIEVTADYNDDNVGLWISWDAAPGSFSAGQQGTFAYTITAFQ